MNLNKSIKYKYQFKDVSDLVKHLSPKATLTELVYIKYESDGTTHKHNSYRVNFENTDGVHPISIGDWIYQLVNSDEWYIVKDEPTFKTDVPQIDMSDNTDAYGAETHVIKVKLGVHAIRFLMYNNNKRYTISIWKSDCITGHAWDEYPIIKPTLISLIQVSSCASQRDILGNLPLEKIKSLLTKWASDMLVNGTSEIELFVKLSSI